MCVSVCLCVCVCLRVYSQNGDSVGGGLSTHVPFSATRSLGQVQTGPLGLSRHNHSHFFLSHGLVTESQSDRIDIKNQSMITLCGVNVNSRAL